MGSLQAQEFGGAVNRGELSLAAALGWHLQSNHYPPVPTVFNPVCEKAIEAASDEEWDTLIDLPEGIEWKDGREAVEAHVLIESFRLDHFVRDNRSHCPVCGDVIDFCQGHGEIGDPAGFGIMNMHDADDHSHCHPNAGCE